MELSVTYWLIAGYVGFAMFLAQLLYTRYRQTDARAKGKIPMGIRFEGNFKVRYKCSYWFAVILLFVSVTVVAWRLSYLPEVGSFGVVGLIKNSGYLLLALVLLVMLSHFFGTSVTKFGFNLATIGMVYLSLYASIADANFEFLIQCIIAFAAFMGALGVGWFLFFQVPRLKKFEERTDYRKWALIPTKYFWGVYAVVVGGGGFVAILVYGLSH